MFRTTLLLTIALFISGLVQGQLFKHGKKLYTTVVDSWNIEQYKSFLSSYPKSKYGVDITQRLLCKERNDSYLHVINSKDTTALEEYITKFDTCRFCEKFLPNRHLKNLGSKNKDLVQLKDSLESKRAYYYWINVTSKSGPLDFHSMEQFKKRYPKSYFNVLCADSARIRQDRYYWQIALKKDAAVGYKLYCDSVSQGIHKAEAEQLLEEYLLGEKLLAETVHKTITEGLRMLKSIRPQSKFIVQVQQKLKTMEQADFLVCLKKKTLVSWIDFEQKYPYGYYFKDADKKIRTLLGLSSLAARSPFGTLIALKNSLNEPIRSEYKKINGPTFTTLISAGQTDGIIIPNGTYIIRDMKDRSKTVIHKEKLTFSGTPQSYTIE